MTTHIQFDEDARRFLPRFNICELSGYNYSEISQVSSLFP